MSLKKTTLKLSIINTISISLGFIFHILLGRKFGVSQELDCLFVALAIFSIAGIFNSFFTSLFIPLFNEIKHLDEKDSFVFADVTLKWAAIFSAFMAVLVLLSGDIIIRGVASGLNAKDVALTLDITQVLFIAFIFNAISNTIGCVLNALYLFSFPAITGLLHPVLNIAALFVLSPLYGVKGIAISYLASNIIQAVILLVYMALKTHWRPTCKLYHEKMPLLVKQSSKMTASGFIWSLKDVISRNIASHLAPGSITLLAYAEKLIGIMQQIAVVPPSKVFYSKVSELVVIRKWQEIRRIFERIVRVNIAIVLFLASGVVVFLVPLLNLLFLGSRFTDNNINTLFHLVMILLFYIVIAAYETYLNQIASAEKRASMVCLIAAGGMCVFFASAWSFSKLLGVYGIAISTSITQLFVCCLYYYFVNEKLQTSFKKITLQVTKSLIIAVVFVFIGIIMKNIIHSDSIIIFLVMPAWAGFYFFVARLIIKEEIELIGVKEMFRIG